MGWENERILVGSLNLKAAQITFISSSLILPVYSCTFLWLPFSFYCPPHILDCSWLLFVCWFAFVALCPCDQAKLSECCLLRSEVHTRHVITGSLSLGKKRWTLCLCLYFSLYSRYANAVRLFFTICSIKTHQRCWTIPPPPHTHTKEEEPSAFKTRDNVWHHIGNNHCLPGFEQKKVKEQQKRKKIASEIALKLGKSWPTAIGLCMPTLHSYNEVHHMPTLHSITMRFTVCPLHTVNNEVRHTPTSHRVRHTPTSHSYCEVHHMPTSHSYNEVHHMPALQLRSSPYAHFTESYKYNGVHHMPTSQLQWGSPCYPFTQLQWGSPYAHLAIQWGSPYAHLPQLQWGSPSLALELLCIPVWKTEICALFAISLTCN